MAKKKDIRHNGDDFYDKWGNIGDDAFDILCEGERVPVSAEVFHHGLMQHRKRAGYPVSMSYYARWVNENCPPIAGLFDFM